MIFHNIDLMYNKETKEETEIEKRINRCKIDIENDKDHIKSYSKILGICSIVSCGGIYGTIRFSDDFFNRISAGDIFKFTNFTNLLNDGVIARRFLLSASLGIGGLIFTVASTIDLINRKKHLKKAKNY